jgi:glutaminase
MYSLTDSDKAKLDWAIRYLAVSSAPQGDHAAFITEEVAKVVAPVAVNSGLYETEGKFLEEVGEAPVLTLLRLVRHVGN